MKKLLDATMKERQEDVVEEVYVKPKYDWRYENSIMANKNYIDVDEPQEFPYYKHRFVVARALSNFIDTLSAADDVNMMSHIDDKLHYDYLYYKVKKGKRFFKKNKNLREDTTDFKLIQDHYKYNNQRTKEALKLLSKDQINIIRKQEEKGGL
jgi:hypothetical protein